MSETAQAILAAALSLPDEELEELIERLLEDESPPDNYEGMSEEQFQAEILRRRNEAMNGTPGIPWAEVEAEVLRELNAESHS
jgi:hypothetical protein